ncbi:MAG TPA: hypothetical protein VMW80_07790 [Candidatus Dormibacteraeota bacterium]|jgi:hypothetical protein|nr:hypothetical protein [Candidatus Dormibacteraeota bacterium]
MQRKEARANVRFGLLLTGIGILMLGLGFIWAVLYLAAAHAK